MSGNPKSSEWYSTPRGKRARKGVEVMLSDEARERLGRMAKARKVSRSAVVEELVMGAPLKPGHNQGTSP
jgi:hypothetical protein